MKIGLIGEVLSHSYSKEIHEKLCAPYSYVLHPLPKDELAVFLHNNDFDGFNVTIPYKKEVLPYLSALSDTAHLLGSVNTVIKTENGYHGYNTDYTGFSYLLARSGLTVSGKKVLVLGNGGVCPTVCAVLRDAGAFVTVISRRGEDNYRNLERHPNAYAIVNTTPVGMYPHNGDTPLSLDSFPNLRGVIDLIYNPFETALLYEARERGLIAAGGLPMLIAQAKAGMEIFLTGREMPVSHPSEEIERVHGEMVRSKRNLILIGMPGCGKTTFGRILAEKLGRPFYDTDDVICKKTGKTPERIITEDGEDAFRTAETETIKEICAKSGTVIATGGGCVTRKENYAPMRANGLILYLDRPWEKLPTDGRPISRRTDLSVLYETRVPLYRMFADAVIPNTGTTENTSEKLFAAEREICPERFH